MQVCPTGALFSKGATVAEMEKQHNFLRWILDGREHNVWSFSDESAPSKSNGKGKSNGKAKP